MQIRSVLVPALALTGACLCSEPPPAAAPQAVSVNVAPVAVPAPAAQAPAAQAPAPAPADDRVMLELVTVPPGAKVEVDGIELGKTPLSVSRPASPAAHRVVATLDGYAKLERTLQAPRSRRFTLTLRPASAAAAVAAPSEEENDYRLEDLKDPYAH